MNKLYRLLEQCTHGGFDWDKITHGDAAHFSPVFTKPVKARSDNPIAACQTNYIVDNLKQLKRSDYHKYADPRHPLMSMTADTNADSPRVGGMWEDADGQTALSAPRKEQDKSVEKEREYDGSGEEIAKAQKDSQSQFSKPATATFQEGGMGAISEAEEIRDYVTRVRADSFMQYFRDRGKNIEAGDYISAVEALVQYVLKGTPIDDIDAKSLATQFEHGDLHYMIDTLLAEKRKMATQSPNDVIRDIYRWADPNYPHCNGPDLAPPKPNIKESYMDELNQIIQRILTLYEGYGDDDVDDSMSEASNSSKLAGTVEPGRKAATKISKGKDKTAAINTELRKAGFKDPYRSNHHLYTGPQGMAHGAKLRQQPITPHFVGGELGMRAAQKAAGQTICVRRDPWSGEKKIGFSEEVDEGRRLRTAAMAGLMALSALGAGRAKAATPSAHHNAPISAEYKAPNPVTRKSREPGGEHYKAPAPAPYTAKSRAPGGVHYNSKAHGKIVQNQDAASTGVHGARYEDCEDMYEGKRLRTAAMAALMGLSALGAGKAKADVNNDVDTTHNRPAVTQQDKRPDTSTSYSNRQRYMGFQHSHPDSTQFHFRAIPHNMPDTTVDRHEKDLVKAGYRVVRKDIQNSGKGNPELVKSLKGIGR